VCLTLVVSGSALARSTPVAGPNLVPNPSFEVAQSDAAVDHGVPVPPVGWTFEGATIVFDYRSDSGRTGNHHIAVSGSLAPGREICDASTGTYKCVANPAASVAGLVTETSLPYSSIRPFWISAAAIPVAAGHTYRFGMYSLRPSLDPNAGVDGEGPVSKVRWVDASGSTVKVVDGPQALKTAKRELGYRFSTLDVVAPAGAVGAKLMLGHSDYTVTSAQVAFDDISFAEVLKR
jgi:hypothetical protein